MKKNPAGRNRQVAVSLPPEVIERLEREAKRRACSVAQVAREVVVERYGTHRRSRGETG